MKTRMFIFILILVLAVLIIAGSCATGKKAHMPEEELLKKLSGTWVNDDYESVEWFAVKWVVRSDGTYEQFADSTDTDRMGYGEYKTIVDAWTDTEGNFFYKATFKDFISASVLYQLGKINSSGTEWEFIWSGVDFPPELDSNHSNYSIYYRQ